MVHAEGNIVSHGYSYFGDLKYPADFPHLDYVNPDAPKGGEVAISNERGTFDSFNPYARKGVPAALSSINIERLMSGVADEVGTQYGLIAESLEYPADQSWVIFTLRPEVRFADGTPTTAHDVAFTHELFMEQGLISFREGVKRIIANVEALDDRRVKFTFVPDSPVRERIVQAGATPVMSKAWFEATGARLDESRLEPAMGTGAYMLDRFDINERVVYRRNPDYWGADLPINRGRWNFDRIRIEYFADSNAAFEGFKAGAYTFRIENSSKIWATGYEFPAIEDGFAVQEVLVDGAQASGQGFVFNLRREKFQDPRVREAIGLMFNFEWSNKTLFYGLYKRGNSFAENSPLAASGLPDDAELALLEPLAEQLPEGVLDSEPFTFPPSGERQLDRKALRRAAALLDEAGWLVGDDGMRRNAAGQTLKVEFLERSPAFDRVINPYVENLRRLGVDAKLNRVDNAQFVDRRYAFDYDVITDHLGVGEEPGGNLEQSYGSKEAAVSVFNSGGLADPAVDALINVARNASTREELTTAVHALDRVMRAKRYWVPQWYKPEYWVAYYDMFEHPAETPPYDLGYLDFWWFNPEKHEALKAEGALR
ncbi:extracellular solute-binding protein [Aliiroseovarius sp.]|uniref:extracellular solute-binding protein n=1 Tax=Aliiroseovarius sp. TaxID=1872442 RepID=UPI003BAA79C9